MKSILVLVVVLIVVVESPAQNKLVIDASNRTATRQAMTAGEISVLTTLQAQEFAGTTNRIAQEIQRLAPLTNAIFQATGLTVTNRAQLAANLDTINDAIDAALDAVMTSTNSTPAQKINALEVATTRREKIKRILRLP
jgi:hypothetical protein